MRWQNGQKGENGSGGRGQQDGKRNRNSRPSPLNPGYVGVPEAGPELDGPPLYQCTVYQIESPLPGCPNHEVSYHRYVPGSSDVDWNSAQLSANGGSGVGWAQQDAMSQILSTSPSVSPSHCRMMPPSGVGPEGNLQQSQAQQMAYMPQQAFLSNEGQMEGDIVRFGKRNAVRKFDKAHQDGQINQMKNNEITRKEPPWVDVTTVMMRNLPNKYTQQMLLEELQLNGFRLQADFDFFYLPMDHSNAVNLGYCFINFCETPTANAFAATFQGQRMRRFNSSKTVVVMPASIQGYDRNCAYYSSTRVAQAEDPQYRPIFCRMFEDDVAHGGQHFSPESHAQHQFQQQQQQQQTLMPVQQQQLPQQPPQPLLMEQSAQCGMQPTMAWLAAPVLPQAQVPTDKDYDTDEEREMWECANRRSVYAGPPCQVQVPDEETVARAAQHLFIRNTFVHVPQERSPSVERQVQSCPVSAAGSASGSARIDTLAGQKSKTTETVDAQKNNVSMSYRMAVVGETKDCGVSDQDRVSSTATSSLRNSSSKDAALPMPDSSCGSIEVRTDSTPSEMDGPVLGTAELPCKGAVLHRWGACKPCAFNGSEEGKGCKNGTECNFCHLCEPGEKKRRKKERQAVKRETRSKMVTPFTSTWRV